MLSAVTGRRELARECVVDQCIDGLAGAFLVGADFVSDMIGIDRDEQPAVAYAAEGISGWNDPQVRDGRDRAEALAEVGWYLTKLGHRIAKQRRAEPRDDLMSSLANTTIDGEGLNASTVLGEPHETPSAQAAPRLGFRHSYLHPTSVSSADPSAAASTWSGSPRPPSRRIGFRGTPRCAGCRRR